MDIYEKYYKKNNKHLSKYLTKILLSIIFLLVSIIYTKNDTNKEYYKNIFFNDSIYFTKVNNWYQKYFGKIVPIPDVTINNTMEVFNQDLTYQSKEKYLNGYILKVSDNYMVPVLDSGIIVFLGEKESYGNTCIVQGNNGVDIWYSNIDINNLSLYDYVKKGDNLAATLDNNLYLVFMKDNNYITYEEYYSN